MNQSLDEFSPQVITERNEKFLKNQLKADKYKLHKYRLINLYIIGSSFLGTGILLYNILYWVGYIILNIFSKISYEKTSIY